MCHRVVVHECHTELSRSNVSGFYLFYFCTSRRIEVRWELHCTALRPWKSRRGTKHVQFFYDGFQQGYRVDAACPQASLSDKLPMASDSVWCVFTLSLCLRPVRKLSVCVSSTKPPESALCTPATAAVQPRLLTQCISTYSFHTVYLINHILPWCHEIPTDSCNVTSVAPQ